MHIIFIAKLPLSYSFKKIRKEVVNHIFFEKSWLHIIWYKCVWLLHSQFTPWHELIQEKLGPGYVPLPILYPSINRDWALFCIVDSQIRGVFGPIMWPAQYVCKVAKISFVERKFLQRFMLTFLPSYRDIHLYKKVNNSII